MTTKSDTIEVTKQKLKKPGKYVVLLHNDDTTPMDFVMSILIQIFRHTPEAAYELTMKIHNSHKAVVGSFYKEIAEEKTNLTIQVAAKAGFPLKATVEEE